MREIEYDYDSVYKVIYEGKKSTYKDMPEEWYVQKSKEEVPNFMFNLFKTNVLYRMLQEGYGRWYAVPFVDKIFKYLPEELYVNLEEYIDEKPISDIKLHGVSLKDIINQYGEDGRKEPFIDACEAMIAYIKTGYVYKGICFDWNPRM